MTRVARAEIVSIRMGTPRLEHCYTFHPDVCAACEGLSKSCVAARTEPKKICMHKERRTRRQCSPIRRRRPISIRTPFVAQRVSSRRVARLLVAECHKDLSFRLWHVDIFTPIRPAPPPSQALSPPHTQECDNIWSCSPLRSERARTPPRRPL